MFPRNARIFNRRPESEPDELRQPGESVDAAMIRQVLAPGFLDSFTETSETVEPRRWLQRERGLCSDPDRDAPIAGWCATCDPGGRVQPPQWCERRLSAHPARGPPDRQL